MITNRLGEASAAHRAWIVPLSIALFALTLPGVLTAVIGAPLKDDVAWLLHVARDVIHGRKLYADVIEINPPLIVWILAVPAALAELSGVPAEILAILLLAAAVLAAAWWAAVSLRGYSQLFAHPVPIFAAIGVVLLVMPGVEFGQREHLLAAFALPYICLHARRQQGYRPPLHVAMSVGAAAALGCAMKPHYVLAFVLLEVVGGGRRLPLRRAEVVSAAALLVAYAVGIVLLFPAYLETVVPLTVDLYGASDVSFGRLLFESHTLLFGLAIALMLLLSQRGPARRDPLFLGLVVFACGATLACLVQEKDWFYHRLPATIVVALALLYWMAMALSEPVAVGRLKRLALIAVALAVGAFGQAAVDRLKPRLDFAFRPEVTLESRIERLIEQERAKSYMAFSQSLSPAFPVVNRTGVAWTSRFDSMWALRGEQWRLHEDGREPQWPVRNWVVSDFVAGCPDVVVVDDRDGLDYLRILNAAPAFAAVWSSYRPIAAFDGVRVFERKDGAPAAPPQPAAPLQKASGVAAQAPPMHACHAQQAALPGRGQASPAPR